MQNVALGEDQLRVWSRPLSSRELTAQVDEVLRHWRRLRLMAWTASGLIVGVLMFAKTWPVVQRAADWKEAVLTVLAIVAVAAIAVVLLSLNFRRAPAPPAVEPPSDCTPDRFPKLFELIDRACQTTGLRFERIELCPYCSLGATYRKCLHLSYSLVATLSHAELEAIVLHELGHLADPPALRRVNQLHGQVQQFLARHRPPFRRLYRHSVDRLERAATTVSRQVEFDADAFAAHHGSSADVASMLVSLHRSPLWYAYLDVVRALLRFGVRLPIFAGYASFVREQDKASWAVEMISEHADDRPLLLASHPTLAERLSALGVAEPVRTEGDSLDLIGGAAAWEDAFYAALDETSLKAVSWEQLGPALVEHDRQKLKDCALASSVLRVRELPAAIARPLETWHRLHPERKFAPPDEKEDEVVELAKCSLIISLADAGFVPSIRPGTRLMLSKGDVVVRPVAVLDELRAGDLTAARFVEQCVGWLGDGV